MASGAVSQVTVAGRRLRLSNLDKVLYPATGTTKAEVLDYVTRIAPLLIPHVAGRPVTRKRWPEGVTGPPFFAKALEPGAPAWIPRHPIDHSSGAKDYPLVEDLPTLVYLAQAASLELHVPQWRFAADGTRRGPDRLVLDLDPGPGVGLVECAQVARWARLVLEDLGMPLHPVTSGSAGIHLYAHLDGTRTSDEISAFARELARLLEADHPDLVVSRMAKSVRLGKVFLDWSQNNGSKTTIAPYSLRGRSEPTVAAPRTWEELDDPELRHVRFDEMLERARRYGDLLAPLAPGGGPLTAATPLARYLAKRTAGRTPEPLPAAPDGSDRPAGTGTARFVVQEHHASRLHWDLRLERDGVLMSWAVPRGIPASSDSNHLAVMTEPHPLAYLDFAGEIPAGEYGAGTMTIWDVGVYEAEKWRDDEVIFTLHGRADGPVGSGRFALIRTAGSGEKSQWLLHRMKADAGPGRARPAATATESASPPRPRAAPMLSTPATPAEAGRAAARWGDAPWVEFKWDGVRALGIWDGSALRLQARSGTDITARYPELTAIDVGFGPAPAVVDGEIVARDGDGRPSFSLLQHRMHLTAAPEIDRERRRIPVEFYLFDILAVAGDDLTLHSLRERRTILEALARTATSAITVPPIVDDIDVALRTARELSLEGIVVKDPRSRYRPGIRSEDWLKLKLTRTQEVVIGAIRPGRGGRSGAIGSLLLGIPSPDGLRYVGRVGSGFSDRTLRLLRDTLEPLRADANPFVGVPTADAADALWVQPRVVAEVEFAEFTPAGTLRHARWRGLRPDIAPDEVTRG